MKKAKGMRIFFIEINIFMGLTFIRRFLAQIYIKSGTRAIISFLAAII